MSKKQVLPPRPTGPVVAQFSIDDLPDQYGLKVTGSCLEPEITDNSVVVVSKSEVPQTGDFVVLHFRPEARQPDQDQLVIKRLATALPKHVKLPYREHPESEVHQIIFVETLTPPESAWFELQDLVAVHKVLGVQRRKEPSKPQYLDAPPAGWFPLDVMKAGPGRKWDWCALMIDVHPDELKHCHSKTAFLYVHPDEYKPDGKRTAQEAWVRIPGKHRNKDAAWDALQDIISTPGH